MERHSDNELEILSIPLEDARDATHGWQSLIERISAVPDLGVNIPNGFTIPIKDLEKICAAVKEVNGTHARAYIGVSDDDKGERCLKLYFVGVRNEKDMLPILRPGVGLGNIYDLTHPCPPTCDKDSPLLLLPKH